MKHHSRDWISSLVRLALVVWLGMAGIAAGEPFRHAASGFECPDEIAGFARVGVDDYEKDHPGLGVACKYQLQKDLFADVYIFTAGLTLVPSDITHPLMSQLHEQTLREIVEFARSRGEQSRLINEGTITVETTGGPVPVLYNGLTISSSLTGDRNTWLWLWPARNHVMKIRMTRPPAAHPDPAKVREFYEAVVRLAAS